MIDEDGIRQRWEAVGSRLDERGRRLFAAAEARAAGWGGLAAVSRITGLARSTINRGEDDLDGEPLPRGQVRRKGGGRRSVAETDSGLVPALKQLVEPVTLGDPMRPLIWVSKSMDKLAATLTGMGHPISADTVRKQLTKLGFSRQYNRKADEGSRHPDRDAQFEHINAKVVAAQAAGQPVISVDTKKKELIGNYRNGGTDYRPKGSPLRVKVHDFEDKKLGKVVPYVDESESLSHSKWECKYHVVFIPKCRRKTLYEQLRRHLGEVFRKLAEQKESRILEGHLMPDHVHMLIAIPPKYAVSQVVGFIKGKSAIHLARVYGERRRNFVGQSFWARGYFVSTVGRDEATVREYIRNQEQEDARIEQLNLWG